MAPKKEMFLFAILFDSSSNGPNPIISKCRFGMLLKVVINNLRFFSGESLPTYKKL